MTTFTVPPSAAVRFGLWRTDQLPAFLAAHQIVPHYFADPDSARALAVSRTVKGFVLRGGGRSALSVAALMDGLSPLLRGEFPILAELSTEAITYDQIGTLLRMGFDIRPISACARREEVVVEMAAITSQGPLSPAVYLLSLLREKIPNDLWGVLIPAIVVGGNQCTLSDLCGLTPYNARAVRQRLHAARLPSPLKLLGIICGYSVAYRTHVLSQTLPEAARAAGFATEDGLRQCLSRRSGLTPTGWSRLGVFGATELLLNALRLH
jgi:hypothetical protein